MKTKLTFTLAAFCFAVSVNAQKPFKELGLDDEVEVITLSNGRYIEHFTYDTLRQIGSVMFNTVTGKVEHFISDDDLEKMSVAKRNREVSRFMSIDPLTKQFPELTPYQYASNRPIDGIDLDGLEHASYTIKLNEQGKTLQSVETSRYIHDVGQKGWGTQYTFVDEKGNKVFQMFKPSDPPIVWTGANRPLYVSGVKVVGKYNELEGADGFKNGGWQTMVSTVGLLFGVGELAMATKGAQYLWGALSVAMSADDLISTDGKSLSENIAGSDNASVGIKLTKSALSFRSAISSTLKQIDNGVDAIEATSTLINSFGGVDNFKKAYDSFNAEVQQATEKNSTEEK